MKKKYFGLALAVMMMAQPLLTQAAVNPSANAGAVVQPSRDRDDSKSSSKPLDTSSAAGAGITTGATGNVAVGIVGSAGTTTSGDNTVSGGGGNTITIGDTTIHFANNEENRATFPWEVVETINIINSGTTPLYRAIGTPETVGYNPLIPVQTLVVVDAATQTKMADPVTITLYVPNLMESLNNVQILYYNEETKKWEFMTPSAVDFGTKQISVTLKGDTPFTVVYKNN